MYRLILQSPSLVDSPAGCGLFHSVVRLGGLILYCDFLCDNHSTHGESTTWIVRNRVAEIVTCLGSGENPVREFVSAMHRSPASSGLLFQVFKATAFTQFIFLDSKDSPSPRRRSRQSATPRRTAPSPSSATPSTPSPTRTRPTTANSSSSSSAASSPRGRADRGCP